jgi:LuxR family maltose regulon positive regulatory protein
MVGRQRLTDLVAAGIRDPVTLLCAGAGWGKTTLVAAWAKTSPARVAWLTLAEQDNDPGVFGTHVVAALRLSKVAPSRDPLPHLGRPDASPQDFLVRVLRSLTRLPEPAVLVLDDFHEIDEPQVLAVLAALVRYPPDGLHLVLLTRPEPALALHRLRAAGALTEIRAADLAFRADEAAELAAALGIHLDQDGLAALLARTEGWPTGLRLALSFLRRGEGRRIDDFTGDERTVADYLMREVLVHQPPESLRLMLRTSVVDEVCPDLADTLTEAAHGGRVLEELERNNAFVQGHGSEPRWFRYHRLLRDLLRQRLALDSPALPADLHLRAAHWYASHNRTREALDHAAATPDWPLVGRLTVARSPWIVAGERAYTEVLKRIPGPAFSATPELVLSAALLLLGDGDHDGISYHVARARAMLDGRVDGAARLRVKLTLRVLEATAISRVRGDMPALVAAATDILTWLGGASLSDVPALSQHRTIALCNKGVGLLWSGDADHAERYLWAAATTARATELATIEVDAIGHLALCAYLRGSIRDAQEHAHHARSLAQRHGLDAAAPAVAAHLALALAEIERNNIAEAELAFQQGYHAHRSDPEGAQRTVAALTWARLLTARGDLDAARMVLRQARQHADPRQAAPALDRWSLLNDSELRLLSGGADAVASRYESAGIEVLSPPEAVCLARAHLLRGDLDRAEVLSVRARETSTGGLFGAWAWAITALITDARGQGNKSVEALANAVAIARWEDVHRPFLAIESPRLAALVQRHRWLLRENTGFAGDLITELEPDRGTRPATLDTAMSERELEVLSYLPTVLTAAEVAENLYVSVNTVKAHLRSIYRKLGVSRRRDAVIRAREWGLL